VAAQAERTVIAVAIVAVTASTASRRRRVERRRTRREDGDTAEIDSAALLHPVPPVRLGGSPLAPEPRHSSLTHSSSVATIVVRTALQRWLECQRQI
jgi:hypothetical protein